MRRVFCWLAAGVWCLALAPGAWAQKAGGILRLTSPDSPASMSIHEESTIYAQAPMMGVFNNLIMFDQQVRQVSLASIVPDLATAWAWNADGTVLTFELRQGVRFHDGMPFTSKDVQCTFDLLLERGAEKLRVNPRRTNFRNLDKVTIDGDFRVVDGFQLRPYGLLKFFVGGVFRQLDFGWLGLAERIGIATVYAK